MNNEISEFNRNCRTLVVSFVIAIMAMIPMRFVEVGQLMTVTQPTVLGAAINEQQVVLPNAEVKAPLFEAPYDQEMSGNSVLGASTQISCTTRADADRILEGYAWELETVKMNDLQKQDIANKVLAVEAGVCR